MFYKILSGLIAIASLITTLALLIYTPSTDITQFETKKEMSQTMLLYRLQEGDIIKFFAAPDDRKFYIISHSLLAEDSNINPYDVIDYSFFITFFDEKGIKKFEIPYYVRTKESKIPIQDGMIYIQNAFLQPGEGRLTDSRTSSVPVSGYFPKGGSITLTLKSTKFPILLRIHRQEDRDITEKEQKIREARLDKNQIIAKKIGLESIRELSYDEEQRLFRYKLTRVEAFDLKGQVAPTKRIYYNNLDNFMPDKDNSIYSIPPFKSAAVNSEGEGQLFLSLLSPEEKTEIEYYTLTINPEKNNDLPIRKHLLGPHAPHFIKLDEGARTLFINNLSDHEIFLKTGSFNQTVKAVGYSLLIKDPVNDKISYLTPEIAKMEGYLVMPETDKTISYSVMGSNAATIYKLEIRKSITEKEKNKAKIVISFLDRSANIISSIKREMTFTESRFENLDSILFTEDKRAISDPSEMYLKIPGKTRQIIISSDEIIVVRFFVEIYLNIEEENPYPRNLKGRFWNFAKITSSEWQFMVPENREKLSGENRIISIDAQVRLDNLDKSPGTELNQKKMTEGVWNSAFAIDNINEDIFFLPFKLEENTLEASKTGLWCSIPENTRENIAFPEDLSRSNKGFFNLIYYIPKNLPLGSKIDIFMENERIFGLHPKVKMENLRYTNFQKKEGTIFWNHGFKGGAPKLLFKILDEKAATVCRSPGSLLLKSYTVTGINRSEFKKFSFYYDGRADSVLNIVTYSDQAANLKFSIDNKIPKRKNLPFLEEYTYNKQNSAIPLSGETEPIFSITQSNFEQLKILKTFFYPIKKDLVVGWHTLTIQNAGNSKIWVRIFYQGNKNVDFQNLKYLKVH